MSIYRVSDLPEINEDYKNELSIQFDKSLIEVSFKADDVGGKYQSKAIRCNQLKEYCATDFIEPQYMDRHKYLEKGATISGHVGINEYANDDTMQTDTEEGQYGLFVKGKSSSIESLEKLTLKAKENIVVESLKDASAEDGGLIEIEANTLDMKGHDSVVITSDTEIVTTASEIAMIATDQITFDITNRGNYKMRINDDQISTTVKISTPTITEEDEVDLTVVNIEYLKKYLNALSTQILDEVARRQETEESEEYPTEESEIVVPSAKQKTINNAAIPFEVKMFDYMLDESYTTTYKLLNPETNDNIITLTDSQFDSSICKNMLLDGLPTSNSLQDNYTEPGIKNNSISRATYTVPYALNSRKQKIVIADDSSWNTRKTERLNILKFAPYWYYLYNKDTQQLILPATKYYFAGTSANSDGGNRIEESLPNILGTFVTSGVIAGISGQSTQGKSIPSFPIYSGACHQNTIYGSQKFKNHIPYGSVQNLQQESTAINASSYNGVYKDDTSTKTIQVRPETTKMYMYMAFY